jgi:endonuclease G
MKIRITTLILCLIFVVNCIGMIAPVPQHEKKAKKTAKWETTLDTAIKIEDTLSVERNWGKDTIVVVRTPIYTSYLSYDLREPVVVAYRLSDGGGSNRRWNFTETHVPALIGHTAKAKDYEGSGYDRGHMANAEDFAKWPDSERLTFRYYNCVPQRHELNNGNYKAWEGRIRCASDSDSLFIICGNIYSESPRRLRAIPYDSIAIPDTCFKIVQSLRTDSILHVLLFRNCVQQKDNIDDCEAKDKNATIQWLQKRIGYKLPLKLRARKAITGTLIEEIPK